MAVIDWDQVYRDVQTLKAHVADLEKAGLSVLGAKIDAMSAILATIVATLRGGLLPDDVKALNERLAAHDAQLKGIATPPAPRP